ncbi:MAG: hypothetical protein QXZ17_02715 [Nitrososphaerota archaeon]
MKNKRTRAEWLQLRLEPDLKRLLKKVTEAKGDDMSTFARRAVKAELSARAIETKLSPKKDDKKYLKKVEASFTISQLFILILLSVLFSLLLSAILVIVIDTIMGVGFTLREMAEKILNLFPSIATLVTGLIATHIYIRTRKEKE